MTDRRRSFYGWGYENEPLPPGELEWFEAAYRAWRAEKPLKLKGAYPTRDELHDRPVLRRR